MQRPASVVKELIENALDAKASSIAVIVKDAGKLFVQVTDDGEGMSSEDARLAFHRHATSKISTAEDLEAIRTLGFRGEALASIAAVAQVELKTRQQSEDTGTLLRIEGNELRESNRVAMERGTSVVVKNLFFNTPARRNFLKTRATELKNISDVVTRMAIVYPEVAWHYVSDDEELLELKPSSEEGRLKDLFGERQLASLVRLREKADYISIDGFLGKPEFGRKSRAEQFLYINRRFVVNRAISHAVFQAYEHLLESGKFPFFILNLSLDPHRVDVNVHPSKMEVKFENESNVYRFVLSGIRRCLAAHNLIPTVALHSDGALAGHGERLRFDRSTGVTIVGPPSSTQTGIVPPGTPAGVPSLGILTPAGAEEIDIERLFGKIERRMGTEAAQKDGEATFPADRQKTAAGTGDRVLPHRPIRSAGEKEPIQEGRAIWQVHNKYILSQIRTGLLIVDQHVAHERILYEKALANFENNLPSTQQLLFPQTVQLSASDYTLVKEIVPHLERLGFDIKLFGKNTVVIEGIPADVRVGSEAQILQDVLDEFKRNEHAAVPDARDNLAKSFACKAAIKAGDRLSTTEMIVLIDQLFATQMPYVCPHGRPVVLKISIDELDRRFGRT